MRQFMNGRSVFGWGVQRDDPWHFVGIFPTKAEADLEASRLGEGYCVRQGEHQKGTPFFIVKPPCKTQLSRQGDATASIQRFDPAAR